MAEDEDEVVVTLGNDVDPGSADKKEDPVGALKEQFKELQSQAERDRERAAAAENRASDAAREAERARKDAESARTEVVDSQFETVTSGLEAAQSEARSAEQDYTAAFERGDAAAMAAAQRKMARAEAKILRLDETRADLEIRKKAPDDLAARQTESARRSEPDPIEAYIANRTEPTQKWLREHKDWISDPRKNAKLTAAHYSAQAEGIELESKEYFEHVEMFIGLRGNGTTKTNGAAKPQTRRPSVPVAPVQASGGGTSGGGQEVRLSRGEASAATDGTHVWNYDDPSGQKRFKKGDPIGIQEMARRKLELTRQGAYDRTYTEQ